MESNDHCELDQSEMVKRLKKKKKTLGRVLSKKKDKAKKERLAAIKFTNCWLILRLKIFLETLD